MSYLLWICVPLPKPIDLKQLSQIITATNYLTKTLNQISTENISAAPARDITVNCLTKVLYQMSTKHISSKPHEVHPWEKCILDHFDLVNNNKICYEVVHP
jgi:hypothetical protein